MDGRNGNESDGRKQRFSDGSRSCGEEVLREASGTAEYLQNAKQGNSSKGILKDTGNHQKYQEELPAGGGHTEDDYFALPDDLRVELIEGVFYAMAAPSKLHQATAFEIARQIADCMDKHESSCFLYIAPSDVALGEKKDTIVQPDVYVHCDRAKEGGSGPHRGAPDLAVEVLSSSNPENDLWRKRNLYQKHGVREYWIVNPTGQKVYVFDFERAPLPDSHPEEYGFEDEVALRISEGVCKVDFRKVFRKIRHLLAID